MEMYTIEEIKKIYDMEDYTFEMSIPNGENIYLFFSAYKSNRFFKVCWASNLLRSYSEAGTPITYNVECMEATSINHSTHIFQILTTTNEGLSIDDIDFINQHIKSLT